MSASSGFRVAGVGPHQRISPTTTAKLAYVTARLRAYGATARRTATAGRAGPASQAAAIMATP